MSRKTERFLLSIVVFVVLLAQVLLYPGIDTLVTTLGAETRLDASMWFLAAEFGAFIVFAGVWGAASDATGKRVPFIAAGAIGGALGYAALALLPTLIDLAFADILVLRVLQGAATIGAFSLAMTMLMDLEGGHGRNMAAAGIAIGLGTAIGAPLGGQLYSLDPLLPLYTASLLLFSLTSITVVLSDRIPKRHEDTMLQILTGLRATPPLAVPYAFGFIDRLTAGFFALVGTLYFREVFELDPAMTGIMLGLFFAPFALFQYPMGILSDRIGRTIPIVVGSALYGVGVIAVGLAPTVAVAGIAMVSVGVLGALMSPATMALVTDLAGDTERGVAMAGFNIFGSVGFLTGIVLGGTFASTYGYLPAFIATGSLEILLALLTLPVFIRMQVGPSSTFTT
jgi:MFS family permease